jgi:hypothetical protein
MLKPVQKLKEKIQKRKAEKAAKKEPQMYKKPSGAEDGFRSIGYKKGGAVKKVTAKKVMVKSKKK